MFVHLGRQRVTRLELLTEGLLGRYARAAMSDPDRLQIARRAYEAYETGDRAVVEELLTDDYVFSSPADVGIDRPTYFERCWPNAQRIGSFAFERLAEIGADEVLVTYVCTRVDGTRFRNTEILTFRGERLCRTEVYFGWDLD